MDRRYSCGRRRPPRRHAERQAARAGPFRLVEWRETSVNVSLLQWPLLRSRRLCPKCTAVLRLVHETSIGWDIIVSVQGASNEGVNTCWCNCARCCIVCVPSRMAIEDGPPSACSSPSFNGKRDLANPREHGRTQQRSPIAADRRFPSAGTCFRA